MFVPQLHINQGPSTLQQPAAIRHIAARQLMPPPRASAAVAGAQLARAASRFPLIVCVHKLSGSISGRLDGMCYMMWNRTGGITWSFSAGLGGDVGECGDRGGVCSGGESGVKWSNWGKEEAEGRGRKELCWEDVQDLSGGLGMGRAALGSAHGWVKFTAMFFCRKAAPETSAPARVALGGGRRGECPGTALAASEGL